jgi:hypothetical protein
MIFESFVEIRNGKYFFLRVHMKGQSRIRIQVTPAEYQAVTVYLFFKLHHLIIRLLYMLQY